MVIRWIVLLTLFLPSISLAAPALSERDWQILKTIARNGGAAGITLGTDLPATCTPGTGPNAFFLDTDTGVLSFCSTTDTFTAVLTGVTLSLDIAYDGGRVVDGATLAAPVEIGNGIQGVEIGGDATLGGFIRPKPLGDSTWRCWTNFNCIIRDEESAATVFTIDPDAASKNAMYQFGANYRPLKSFFIPAGYLSTDGTQCAAPAESTPIASGAKLFTVICADNDGSRMHASMDMPDDYDGGTILIKPSAVQTDASAGVIEYQAAAQCKGDTETLVATSSYGTEVVWTDTMTGSGAIDKATSGAITPSGTCAAGDWLSLYLDIGATNTTTAMSTVHILGFKIIYSSTSLSH